MITTNDDTIVAPATPTGKGALSILRMSGPDALAIADSVWSGTTLSKCPSHTVHLGYIKDEQGNSLDQALATVFVAPNSFTGENSVEFTLHGSPWILREVTNLLLRKGARGAQPGEFSQRAYINGRMDLASAEGVADLIAASSRAAHRLAMQQTKGVFSKEFNALRDKLIELASLLELELDFSEEDVEFADRTTLLSISRELLAKIERLTKSYSTGRTFKEGVPVVIAGIPNVGKSTLLNTMLQEEKAIVSDIPGTTRDVIEDTREIDGVLFRFVDTAGLRESDDKIESIGIDLARQRLAKAAIVLWLIDPSAPAQPQIEEMVSSTGSLPEDRCLIPVIAKTEAGDISPLLLAEIESGITAAIETAALKCQAHKTLRISSKEGTGIDTLCTALKESATREYNPEEELILTNARHYGDLQKAADALRRAITQTASGVTPDFIAMDIREATAALSSLTGAITTPDLLASIFTHFCIGK